jgi:fructokinase
MTELRASPRPAILCCGEALIDMAPTSEGAFQPLPGGAVFNTAVALARLGAPSALAAGVSRDLFGARLAAALQADGVDPGWLARSDRPTTLAFVSFEGGDARYAFYDENTAGRMLDAADLPPPPAGAALFFGGVSLCAEPAAAAYEAYAARFAPDHAVMLDPNIRPGFAPDAAAYRARLERMIAMADAVKLSDADAEWLHPDASPETALERLRAAGPALAILTRGARGALALAPSGSLLEVPARPATVVDTIGAGDTFNAGVLAHLHRAGLTGKAALRTLTDDAAVAALRLAARAAAVTVSRRGADPPRAAELDAAGAP